MCSVLCHHMLHKQGYNFVPIKNNNLIEAKYRTHLKDEILHLFLIHKVEVIPQRREIYNFRLSIQRKIYVFKKEATTQAKRVKRIRDTKINEKLESMHSVYVCVCLFLYT